MISTIKILVFNFLFLLFLSMTIKGRPIFTYIYEVISPVTIGMQKATEKVIDNSLSSTQEYSKKLFENSVPKIKDTIKAKASAPLRTSGEPEEVLTNEDKEKLDDLVKTHR